MPLGANGLPLPNALLLESRSYGFALRLPRSSAWPFAALNKIATKMGIIFFMMPSLQVSEQSDSTYRLRW